jgi:hypothetical protein
VDVGRFAQLRPFLYHATARENLPLIREANALDPAVELMRRAGRSDLLRWLRPQRVALSIDGRTVVLSDQAPLAAQRIALYRGWTFADLVQYLNEHVFFWPGTADGPAKTGIMAHNGDDASNVLLRIPTALLLAANPQATLLFCAVNVRASRGQEGRRVPRGPHLFSAADVFPRREIQVVEAAFRSRVALGNGVTVRSDEEWIPLDSHKA